MDEIAKTVTVMNRLGLHARPAAEFVKVASRYDSDIWVEKDGLEVNGKSIMGVMMLAAETGSRIRIRAVGRDADAALSALCALVLERFGEEDEPPEDGEGVTDRTAGEGSR